MAVCSSIPGANFLGASVIDFNASAGWGLQSSEVTINLAVDCYERFTIPLIGAAATFVMGDFIFTGLVQSWNSKQGTDGEIYSVKLVSPHAILEHTQIILDHYEGEVPYYNIANVYGFLESLGANCSQTVVDGTYFGAPAGGFGTANKTNRGIPWYLVRQALEALAGGGSGGVTKYCKGLGLADTQYLLDLSSIPLANENYRITGPVTSLSDIIDQVCQDAGCDYYIQSIPMALGRTRGHLELCSIKIVVIPRKDKVGAQSAISRFIAGKNVLNRNIGVELRSEVNSAFLIGGKVKQYYQAVRGATPFWGWDAEGELIKSAHNPALGNLGWAIELDCRKINLALTNNLADKVWIGVNELRMAAGDYESFETNVTNPTNNQSNLYKYYVDTLGIGELSFNKNRNRGAGDAPMDVQWNAEDDDPRGNPASEKFRDAKTVHGWLNSYVSEFYGKKFLVYFSIDTVVCRSVDSDTQQVVYSDIISSDGAWPHWNGAQEASHILGLPNPSFAADRFKDDSGKVQPMIKFHGDNLNTKGLNQDDFVLKDKDIWIKASVDDKYVDGTPLVGGPKNLKCALVTLANPVIDTDSDVKSVESNRPLAYVANQGPVVVDAAITTKPANKNPGGQGETAISFGPSYNLNPYGIGVPMESTTTCYGPWKAAGADPGGTSVEVDDGLVPWEYGGFSYMWAAGAAKIADSYTNQQDADRGEVTVPGLPLLSLANNLGGQGVISNYDRGNSLYRPNTNHNQIGGINSSYMYFNSNQQGGAVISNISVSVGAGGVTTTYTVNSFTPVFGRFSKGNADRLKQIGLNQQKNERSRRANQALQNLLRTSVGQNRSDTRSVSTDIGKGTTAPKSPGTFLVGKYLNVTGTRKMVLVPTKTTMPYYAKSEANDTAAMTMDGLLRPVQSNWATTVLPRVVGNTKECGGADPTQTSGPPPPVDGQTPLPITTQYLNFLLNPKEVGDETWVGYEDDRASGSVQGHDIEGVARGTAGDEWGGNYPGKLLMRAGDGDGQVAGQTDYDAYSEYRFLALRGPLMVQGWGYDVNGNPIPNEKDASAHIGSFKTDYTDLTNQFAENWLESADTWPVAPVDLRFDRKRGVWTIPSAFRLYQIETSGDIIAGSFGHGVVKSDTSDLLKPDEEGNWTQIIDPKISVKNWTDSTIPSGEKALAYYDTSKCEYWIMPSASGGGSGALRIGATGCVQDSTEHIECFEMESSGCLILSGLGGMKYNRLENKMNGEGPDFIVSGPLIQSGKCDGGTEGDAIAFEKLTFVSGLRSVRGFENNEYCQWKIAGTTFQESGCGTTGPVKAFEHILLGSGLTLDTHGGDCTGVLAGPKIQSGTCGGGLVGPAKPFGKLTFVSGLTAVEVSDCNWNIGGPTIRHQGCFMPDPTDSLEMRNLTIGTGLVYTPIPHGRTCDVMIAGPQIQKLSCLGVPEGIPESFDELRFVSGLTATKFEAAGCKWMVGGTTIQSSGCGEETGSEESGPYVPGPSATARAGLSNLIVGSGLGLQMQGECNWMITAPKIQYAECLAHSTQWADALPFGLLKFGTGTSAILTNSSDCEWTIAGPKLQSKPCGQIANPAHEQAAGHFDILQISTGLSLVGGTTFIGAAETASECVQAIIGPKVGGYSAATAEERAGAGTEEGYYESLPKSAFETLFFDSDTLTVEVFQECIYKVKARTTHANVGSTGECEEVVCSPFTGCLVFEGFDFIKEESGSFTVKGPTINANEESIGGANHPECPAGMSVPACNEWELENPNHGQPKGGHFTTLTIGEGLELKGSDCEYTLEASGGGSGGCDGITTGIDVVTSICCSGSTFNVTLSRMIFDSGCLSGIEEGTQECASPGE